jgi:hypothetical protein
MLHTSLALPTVEGWYLCQMEVKRSIFKWIYEVTNFEDDIGQVCQIYLWIQTSRDVWKKS